MEDGPQRFYEHWRNLARGSNFPDDFPYELSLGLNSPLLPRRAEGNKILVVDSGAHPPSRKNYAPDFHACAADFSRPGRASVRLHLNTPFLPRQSLLPGCANRICVSPPNTKREWIGPHGRWLMRTSVLSGLSSEEAQISGRSRPLPRIPNDGCCGVSNAALLSPRSWPCGSLGV